MREDIPSWTLLAVEESKALSRLSCEEGGALSLTGKVAGLMTWHLFLRCSTLKRYKNGNKEEKWGSKGGGREEV